MNNIYKEKHIKTFNTEYPYLKIFFQKDARIIF